MDLNNLFPIQSVAAHVAFDEFCVVQRSVIEIANGNGIGSFVNAHLRGVMQDFRYAIPRSHGGCITLYESGDCALALIKGTPQHVGFRSARSLSRHTIFAPLGKTSLLLRHYAIRAGSIASGMPPRDVVLPSSKYALPCEANRDAIEVQVLGGSGWFLTYSSPIVAPVTTYYRLPSGDKLFTLPARTQDRRLSYALYLLSLYSERHAIQEQKELRLTKLAFDLAARALGVRFEGKSHASHT